MGDKNSWESYIKTGSKGNAKVGKVMKEFGKGKLHIGKSKKKVVKRSQAIAIALSEAGKSKRKS